MCSIIQKIAQRVGDGTNIVRFATCAANMLVIYNKSQKPEYFMRLFRDFYREYQFNLLSPLYEGENANPNVKWLKEIKKTRKGGSSSDLEVEYDGIVIYFQKGNPKHHLRCFQITSIFNAASRYYTNLREVDKTTDLPFQFLRVLYECVYYSLLSPLDSDENEITEHEKKTIFSTIEEIKEQIECINSALPSGSGNGSSGEEGIFGKVISGMKSFFDPSKFNKDTVTSLIQNFAPKDVADSVGNVIGATQKAMSDSNGNLLEAFSKIKDDPSIKETYSTVKNIAEKKFGEITGELSSLLKMDVPSVDTSGGQGSVDPASQE